jgi:DNA repair ATPase RecN
MLAQVDIKRKLATVFNEQQATTLAEVIHGAYNQLVRASDFNELKGIVSELATAQQQTEQYVKELAAAQQRTEQRVEELAAAQQRTERALQRLSRQVGGLSDRLGGDLEDIAYIVIHDVLKRDLGWQVGPLERGWLKLDDRKEEIDIL